MPLRVVITLATLFAAIPLVVLLAWLSGSELYFFFPTRNLRHTPSHDFQLGPPPTHPGIFVAILLIICTIIGFSRHYGLLVLAVLPAGLLLGTVVGAAFLDWTPGVCQYLLILVSLAALTYGWSKKEYLDF